MANPQTGPVAQRYSLLQSQRDPFLTRARRCAEVTIPTLVPPEGASGSTIYPTPYQSLGARGVNNLSAKLLLALLPPNSPFFRLAIDDFTLEKLAQREGARAQVDVALSKIERAVMTDIETTPTRAPAFEALKHLLVAGNILLYMQPGGGLKAISMDKFVCKRDAEGNVLEHISKECVSALEIPEKHRKYLLGEQYKGLDPNKKESVEDNIDVYTHVKRTDKGWTIGQEVFGKVVPETTGFYPLDKSPWLALRFIAISGEDYGRSFVEEYLGDLLSLEGLSKAIVEASAAAAKVLFLVKPNSSTSAKDLAEKESGDFASGNAEDVSVLQLDKYADFRVAREMMQSLAESLSFAFMLHTSVQRQAERVTAEEIRYMANELEAGLGGVYSTLSQEFQFPFVVRKLHTMERDGKLPSLPKGIVKPMITTGLEAIGRGNDLNKLKGFLEDLAPLGEETIALYLNVSDYIQRAAAARGIDHQGLINSEEQVAASRNQAQMMDMVNRLGPNVINQVGGMAKDQLDPSKQGAQ